MNTAPLATALQARRHPGIMLFAGIVLASLTEAIAGTLLSLGRGDIMGDTHATPDEFAWLDVGYTSLKLIGFMAAPWLLTLIHPRSLAIGATVVMGAACGLAAVTARLDLLIVLRLVQGLAGAALLVGGQALIFRLYPSSRQPLLQALFAMGSVVAPATVAPVLQGWLLDSHSWDWIFLAVVPVAMGATGLMLLADDPPPVNALRRPFDWIGLSLVSVALFCLTYVLSQGSRWDWFEETHIVWLTMIGAAALLAFLVQQAMAGGRGMLDFTLFKSEDFCFAFAVSFVAGAALFGSSYLIPSFAVSVLAFTPTAAGRLLLPSGALFAAALLIAAFLFQSRRVPPIATVPFGIPMIMASMWMLSGSTSESGNSDMMAAILLRGLGLGFLFLSLTLTAFTHLKGDNLASGIGLFNTGRQLGGLIGVAWLQTLIEHNVAGNLTVLAAHVTNGIPAVSERLATMTSMLVGKGMGDVPAGRVAMALLDKSVIGQSTVIAFDTAFNAVALIFVFAAPVLVTFKVCLHRFAHKTVTIQPSAERPILMTDPMISASVIPMTVSARDPLILPQTPTGEQSETYLRLQLKSAM
jgi:DHA2 family multidrug resistance protein